MFDVGFSELMVIAVVALIVIGPERLPKVARTLGHLVGRLQRYVNDVKADINREIELDELRKFKSTFEDAAREVEHTVHSEAAKAESELSSIAQAVDPAAATAGLTNAGGAATQELQAAKTEIETAGRSIEGSGSAADSPAQPGPGEPGQAPQKSAA
jgi:sec-independent protein translocase protein TatB